MQETFDTSGVDTGLIEGRHYYHYRHHVTVHDPDLGTRKGLERDEGTKRPRISWKSRVTEKDLFEGPVRTG